MSKLSKQEHSHLLNKLSEHIKVEFTAKDMMQVLVGASILAIPVALTEETWRLGQLLPLLNILALMSLSFIFISIFTYFHYYKDNLHHYMGFYVSRVISTYLLSFLIVAILLTVIQKTPWTTDFIVAFKRTVIVSFPASLSGAIADTLK